MVLIVPFVEEAFYRLGLKFSIRNTTFLILGFLYTFYLFFQPSDIDFNNPKVLFSFFGIMVLTWFTIRFLLRKNKDKVEKTYKKYPKLIFISSAIVFAYSHYILHDNHYEIQNILYSPLIMFPYFIAGLLFGTIRLRLGFFYAVLAHSLWNFIAVLINKGIIVI